MQAMSESSLDILVRKAEEGYELTEAEVRSSADLLASPDISPAPKEAFLLALAAKGETPSEIAAFAGRFRELAVDPELDDLAEDAIDVCGTGGDKSGSFNVSTFVAFTLAAGGTRVLKHGNRSITSSCGSADLLEGVGIPLQASPNLLRMAAREINFTFFFAPGFHPAFKEVMPVRQKLAENGQRTVFNLLGPLINPARPSFQLLGVFSSQLVDPLAETLHNLGLKRGLVVHGQLENGMGMDEIACCAKNVVSGFGNLSSIRRENWGADDFGLTPHPVEDLAGGNLEENLRILNDLTKNRAPEGLLSTISANAGAGFFITEKANNLREGAAMAKDLILGGEVGRWIDEVRRFYKDNIGV